MSASESKGLWTRFKSLQGKAQILGILVTSSYLAWLASVGLRLGLPQAALDFLHVIKVIEEITIGSWLQPILHWLGSLVQALLGWPVHIEPHGRYAFNLLALKLLGDAAVDQFRYNRELRLVGGDQWSFWERMRYRRHSRKWQFLTFEWLIGVTITIASALLASQYPFGGANMMFAVVVIGGLLLYELLKALGHLWFDLYDAGLASNFWRYGVQFWLFTCVTAGIAFVTSAGTTSSLVQPNDALLCVFVFMLLLAVQQYISAGWTKWKGAKQPYFTLGQVKIGQRILFLLSSTLGWMLIAVLFSMLSRTMGFGS